MRSLAAPGSVSIPCEGVVLGATLAVPEEARGVVLSTPGSGGGRFGACSRLLDGRLNDAGFATLTLELMTSGEQMAALSDPGYAVEVRRLAQRLQFAGTWARRHPAMRALPLSYVAFGTGAAAALFAAAWDAERVDALVLVSGRVDLAEAVLPFVAEPVLLVVSSDSGGLLRQNQHAALQLAGPTRLAVLPGAQADFDGPGELAVVAQLAVWWLKMHASHG